MTITLHTLPKLVQSRKKRLGRGTGSAKGAKSGRGTTRHQAARENIPLSFEGGQGRMIKRFPLLRGKGKNKPVSPKHLVIKLEKLNAFPANAEITLKSLEEKGIIKKGTPFVKIVHGGKLEKKLQVKLPVTQSVKKAIEEAGGVVNL